MSRDGPDALYLMAVLLYPIIWGQISVSTRVIFSKAAIMSSSKSKNHRGGGKFTGSHTTLTDLSVLVADIVAAMPQVTKVAIGIISTGLPPAHGNRRVKIFDAEDGGYIRLVIRDNSAKQDLHVYVGSGQARVVGIAIAGALDADGIRTTFMK